MVAEKITREETSCHHMGYYFRLTARVLLCAPSHRQDNTYDGLCYTSRGALAGMRNSSMGPPWRIYPTTHRTMSERSYHWATSRSWVISMFVIIYVLLTHETRRRIKRRRTRRRRRRRRRRREGAIKVLTSEDGSHSVCTSGERQIIRLCVI